ncbi:MAG: sigma-54-dependent Fis family transcriptional regulator [Desulfobulbaceae bacterium A2]|nr:MAG: sigma-54-dependent Fis family transcriptional regulator [Desulfobulbaceae bacterium A2]
MKNPCYAILSNEGTEDGRNTITGALAGQADVTFSPAREVFSGDLNSKHFDLIFLRVEAQDEDPFAQLTAILDKTPHTPVVITSRDDKVDLIVRAIKLGAFDYLVAPFSPARLQLVLRQAMKQRELRNEIDYLRRKQDIVYDFSGIVAESTAFKKVLASLKKFARTDSTILITGDTGTGKSFLSGSIHFNSPRRHKPFIKINCANIPEALLESELFGHEKGAFTGAEKQRIGRFEQANGGTIFLDEIGEISLELQTKLLRVIEDKSFERVGGNKTIHVDVRVIAATNRDLAHQIEAGRFREDLFYRLNVLPIRLPSLRERPQCLEPLAMVLLDKSCKSLKKRIEGFSPEAMRIIKQYGWPGNIRQLANTIERAVILEDEQTIQLENIALPDFRPAPAFRASVPGGAPAPSRTEPMVLEQHERDLVLKALEANHWIQKNAADQLGISPRALNYKVKKFGLTHPHWRRNR